MATEELTLEEAREYVDAALDLRSGVDCPCCDRPVKVRKRKINSTMAKALVSLYNAGGEDRFIHCPSLPGDTHEVSQLEWWGLVTESDDTREDGGRAGYWKLTRRGVRFVKGEISVTAFALVYRAKRQEHEGPQVFIQDCLTDKFDLRELLSS
jgi:hypothetical protein